MVRIVLSIVAVALSSGGLATLPGGDPSAGEGQCATNVYEFAPFDASGTSAAAVMQQADERVAELQSIALNGSDNASQVNVDVRPVTGSDGIALRVQATVVEQDCAADAEGMYTYVVIDAGA